MDGSLGSMDVYYIYIHIYIFYIYVDVLHIVMHISMYISMYIGMYTGMYISMNILYMYLYTYVCKQHIGRKGGMFFNLLFVSRAVVQVRQLKF